MAVSRLLKLAFLIEVIICGTEFCHINALTMDYYVMRCPFAEMMVRNIVNGALQNDPTLSAALLRMHFHDCFVEGCDGSVLIDSTKGNIAEKDSPANIILRGYEVIDQAKQAIENQCPGVVSCADIVAMAARDAVLWAGGPFYDIPKGRKDGRRSKIEDTINLPPPFFNTSDLIRTFADRGLTVQEMVALSGAHTLGVARCASFKDRLTNSDPTLDSTYADSLSKKCSAGDDTVAPFDFTSTSFDNQYFRALQSSGGLLTSDQTLYVSRRTRGIVDGYAMNQAMFFYDFWQAMVKMGLISVKEGSQGEVRLNCRKIN
ncbi:peroxidase 47-like [Magnolia sinica]|uniref:peroxidase 47-like n=1 Tax=Magnolia sinica TaxID=86752 RepID=UPI00265A9220|nr:peroxidase 47-like [Magnolia sinica]